MATVPLLPHDWLTRDLRELATLAPLQEIALEPFEAKSLRVWVKREDLLHPWVGGNKLYKLHGYFQDYFQRGQDTPVATFGGAYSNHILALAAAGKMAGVRTIGIIRGEQARQLSPTLVDAQGLGMRLHFLSRAEYRQKQSPVLLARLETQLGACYWIPEGGAGDLGARGLEALAEGVVALSPVNDFHVGHACGTGSSVAGLVAGFSRHAVGRVYTHGIKVVKGADSLSAEIADYLSRRGCESEAWRVVDDYHCGGYAKYPSALAAFVQRIEQGGEQEFEQTVEKKFNHAPEPELATLSQRDTTSNSSTDFRQKNAVAMPLLLDPVYTAKVVWALVHLAKHDYFEPGSHLIIIHSGGLQGRRGFGLTT